MAGSIRLGVAFVTENKLRLLILWRKSSNRVSGL